MKIILFLKLLKNKIIILLGEKLIFIVYIIIFFLMIIKGNVVKLE